MNDMVGKREAKALLELDPEDFAVHLQVSNIYSEIEEFKALCTLEKLLWKRI